MEQKTPPPVPAFNKFLYSFGYIGVSIVDRIMATWVMFYYLPPKGTEGLHQLVPAAAIGAVFMIGRTLDTFFDPLVAFWSDRCGSKRGRRTPFMLFGGVPLAVALALMFFPPVKHVSGLNVAYLAVVLSTFYFFFSFYVCPYLGLLPELARTPEDRINLTSSQGIFMLLGTVLAMVGSPFLIGKFGYKGMALLMAGLAALTFYAPLIGINEKKYCVAEPSSLNLIETILETLKNKPFLIYLLGNLTFWFGFNIISSCVPYYVTVLLKRKPEDATIYFAIALGVAFVCIPLINFLSRKIGKRATMIVSLSMFLVLLPSIFLFGDKRVPIDPVLFSYIIIALIGIPLSTLFIVPNAIVADLTDFDEKLTGLRREAIYFGTQGLFQKITLGLSTLLMSLIFAKYGFSEAQPLGVKLTGIVGGIFALTGVIAFLFFPKDLNAHAEKMLKARKK